VNNELERTLGEAIKADFEVICPNLTKDFNESLSTRIADHQTDILNHRPLEYKVLPSRLLNTYCLLCAKQLIFP
jgi:hypothetical protein